MRSRLRKTIAVVVTEPTMVVGTAMRMALAVWRWRARSQWSLVMLGAMSPLRSMSSLGDNQLDGG
ncbi:hypothetical protein [Nocardiopsis alba]|uniref:hypothetical protein n=1 Tax=Nocardiopsis alba TaxID=53437 RepID=UPI003D7150EF